MQGIPAEMMDYSARGDAERVKISKAIAGVYGGVERIPAEMKAYCAGGDPVRVQISRAGAGLFAQKIINKELTGSMDSGPGDLVREFLDGPRVGG